jgi:hypothetical protein
MTLETDLVARLIGDPTVSGLVGDNIYPVNQVEPDMTYPVIVYQRISTITPKVLVGTTGLEAARFQLSVWSDLYSETKTVANAVKAALDGNENTTFENEIDRFDDDVDVNFTVIDFTVWNN